MIKIDGIGGAFLFANDPKTLSEWYARHFGLTYSFVEEGKTYGTEFVYRDLQDPSKQASTVFSVQAARKPLPAERGETIVNYRVLDLEGFLAQLRAAGIAVEKTEDNDYGRFAWIRDPEGNRIELYQPLVAPGTV